MKPQLLYIANAFDYYFEPFLINPANPLTLFGHINIDANLLILQ